MIKGIADATKIAIAIVLAGAIIALAIYMRPVPNRFHFAMANGQIQRFDTATGETMFCPEDSPCFGYDRNGVQVNYQGQENRLEAFNGTWEYETPNSHATWPGNEVTENSASGASRSGEATRTN